MNKMLERQLRQLAENAQTITANDMVSVLDRYGAGIKILSLDCFDTLVWRKTASPIDVLHDLQRQPLAQQYGINASLRCHAEARARQIRAFRQKGTEPKLTEIYRCMLPMIDDAMSRAMADEELALEKSYCFAFLPVVELMRAAIARSIKIIIVSDTYLDRNRLKSLLHHVLPYDLHDSISKIYASSEYGHGKCDGLFNDVLRDMGAPQTILHVGDNIMADYVSATRQGMRALHFIQQPECVQDILRLQATATKVMLPEVQSTQPLFSPFRAILATGRVTAAQPETIVGYASLGPIMYAFARFILDENTALKKAGKKPKLLYLMRDGWLPSLACEKLAGEPLGHRVRISRFASYAASFRNASDVNTYLMDIGPSNRYADIGRQLLLPDAELARIVAVVKDQQEAHAAFCREISRPEVMKIILDNSAQYRQRLMKHLQKIADIQPGDCVVLVDLGYSGTAQRRLTPVFADVGIELIGRYLIALRVPGWHEGRQGLIDPAWCDDHALHTLVLYVSLLEQLCTSNERSVIDYDDAGEPVYSDVTMSASQHKLVDAIQAEALRFVSDAKKFENGLQEPLNKRMLREAALAELTRMVFFPTQPELHYMQGLQAEMNLGTKDILRVYDPEEGLAGLRRRGMFYMEKASSKTRTNYPAELRHAGMEYVLSLLTQHRFALDINMKDMALRQIDLPLHFVRGQETHDTRATANATYEGYYAVWVPTHDQVEVEVGKLFHWLQLESCMLVPMDAFVHQAEAGRTIEAIPFLEFRDMKVHGGGIYEALSDKSAIVFRPSAVTRQQETILRLVFRPLVDGAPVRPHGIKNAEFMVKPGMQYSVNI